MLFVLDMGYVNNMILTFFHRLGKHLALVALMLSCQQCYVNLFTCTLWPYMYQYVPQRLVIKVYHGHKWTGIEVLTHEKR